MPSKIIFSIIFFLISQFAFCQNEKIIHGKIVVKDASAQSVSIINLANEKETVSNEKGEFSIEAKIGDQLVLSSNYLDSQRKIITEVDYKSGSVNIEMVAKTTQLEEVKITKQPELDAVELGILQQPAKKYTQAERHLKTAGDFKPVHLLGLLGGQLPIDPIINSINGKTKRLKKELAIEREESLLATLSELFDDNYYTKNLKIEPDHIKGFQYYAIKDNNLIKALKSKNKALISFTLLQLSIDYNTLQRSYKF